MSGSNGKRINSTASTRRYSSYPAEEKQEAKVTYLTEFELNNQPNMIRNGSSELHNGNNNLVKHSDMSIGTIHILRKHLYITKLNLTSKFFSLNGFFRQNKGISFSTLHFDKMFMLFFS